MAVKRRTIWMSDEEWTALTAFAEDHGQTVSAFIREQAVLTVVLHSAMRPLEPFATEPHTVERHPSPLG